MSIEPLYLKPTEITDSVVRGLWILSAGTYQIRESGNRPGWTAEYSPQGHRDVLTARRFLREQQVLRGLVVRKPTRTASAAIVRSRA